MAVGTTRCMHVSSTATCSTILQADLILQADQSNSLAPLRDRFVVPNAHDGRPAPRHSVTTAEGQLCSIDGHTVCGHHWWRAASRCQIDNRCVASTPGQATHPALSAESAHCHATLPHCRTACKTLPMSCHGANQPDATPYSPASHPTHQEP